MDRTSQNKKGKGKLPKPQPPVQLSIWDILEHPLFEKNLTEEMNVMTYSSQHYAELKAKIEQQYQKDMATLELAKDNQMKELLKDYAKPEELTVKYVEVISKKSKLGSHKRELIKYFFEPLVKRTAIDIINEREKCESKETPTPTSTK